MPAFSIVFILAVFAALACQFWLGFRHIRHIARHRPAVPAAFAETITLSAHQKAADYSVAKTRVGLIEASLGTAILLGLTFGGGIAWWLEQVTAWLPEYPLLQGLLLIGGITFAAGLLELPLRAYRIFGIEARYGFNQMSVGLWITDLIKETLVGAALLLPLLAVILWLMTQAGSFWWLYAWGVWTGFQLLVMLLFPTFIAPLFNRFTPLEDATLKERIEALMRRCGFQAQGLFVMDGSKRSNHGNAYFTGFGRSKRIVFFDTLLNRLQTEEIEAVLAHELGHFKRRHIVKRMAWMTAVSLAVLALLGYLATQPWFFAGLGVPLQAGATTTAQNAVALLLFFLAMPAFTFFLSPLFSLYSRRHEFEADAYAVEQSSAAALTQALVKLYEDNANTLTPDPLHSAFYDSHPPAAIRIARLQHA